MEPRDYKTRSYLSAAEAARYLGITVERLHSLVRNNQLKAVRAASGQYRFDINELRRYEQTDNKTVRHIKRKATRSLYTLPINGTIQKVFVKSSMNMSDLEDETIHLMITSPPYFDTKLYSKEPREEDLGNIHDIDEWFERIGEVWKEVFRVLQPGRKAFINIMNLPIRLENGSFKTVNLVGRTIDLCEKLGFVFRRDIVWHKTNAVRAHFGTYPYPGGILINNTHEFILEFEKPERKGLNKYAHLTKQQKEKSRLEKEFWISIKKSDVWIMKPEGSGDRRSHVAPFPYELPFRLIKAFSFVGETILDPFVGSGTTLLAAADLGRNGIGYEIYPEIAQEAVRRLENYQQKLW